MVTKVFQKYRKGINEITSIYLRSMVRDALVSEASKLTIDKVYGDGKENLIKSVQERVVNQTKDIRILTILKNTF